MSKHFSGILAICCLLVGAGILAREGRLRLPNESPFALLAVPTVSASSGMPDLIVRQDVLAHHWIVRDEDFVAGSCDVIEGGITPGTHQLLRFTVNTANIGDADLALGDPNVHIAANDGLYEFAPCHHHFHFRHYTLYELFDPATGQTWRASKRGFCMIDFAPNPAYLGQPPGKAIFQVCGAPGVPGNQGISAGHADEYIWQLQGQFFVLDGGDGQAPVPPGQYVLRITVNPGFVPAPGEPCRVPDPLHPGVCHQLPESDFENNASQVTITIPDHLGKQEVGPLAGAPPITQVLIDPD